MSKIVTDARAVAEDPTIDGFSHHNPQLGQEDDLFYNALSIDWFMEGFFQGRDLSTNEAQFFCLMRMGILDGREGYDMCQGHFSLDAPSELNPPQRIPSLFGTPLVPQAEG